MFRMGAMTRCAIIRQYLVTMPSVCCSEQRSGRVIASADILHTSNNEGVSANRRLVLIYIDQSDVISGNNLHIDGMLGGCCDIGQGSHDNGWCQYLKPGFRVIPDIITNLKKYFSGKFSVNILVSSVMSMKGKKDYIQFCVLWRPMWKLKLIARLQN